MEECKHWNVSEGGPCPYCGSENLDYDVVHEDDGSAHDIVDCNSCGRRLYYEDY